jgi:hypothetical protein
MVCSKVNKHTVGDLRFSEQCCEGFRSVIVSLCMCGSWCFKGLWCLQIIGIHFRNDTALYPKAQGTTCCQTTQHHIPKHKEPLGARQHRITSQNTGDHLLPDNTVSRPKIWETTCCQTTQYHIPKHNNTAGPPKDLNCKLTFWFYHTQLYICFNCYL